MGVYMIQYIHQFGLVEVKCPYKYRFESIASAAANSDFCLNMTTNIDETQSLQLKKKTHRYYSQVQGQLPITERKWCDFVVYTTKDLFIQQIEYVQ